MFLIRKPLTVYMAEDVHINNAEIWRAIDEIAPNGIIDVAEYEKQHGAAPVYMLKPDEIKQLGPAFTKPNRPVAAIRDKQGRVFFCICKLGTEERHENYETRTPTNHFEYLDDLMICHVQARLHRQVNAEHSVPGLVAKLPSGEIAYLSVVAGYPISNAEEHALGWDVFKGQPEAWAKTVAPQIVFGNGDLSRSNTLIYGAENPRAAIADIGFISKKIHGRVSPAPNEVELLPLPRYARKAKFFGLLRSEVIRVCNAFQQNPGIVKEASDDFIGLLRKPRVIDTVRQEQNLMIAGVEMNVAQMRQFFGVLDPESYRPLFTPRTASSLRRRMRREKLDW